MPAYVWVVFDKRRYPTGALVFYLRIHSLLGRRVLRKDRTHSFARVCELCDVFSYARSRPYQAVSEFRSATPKDDAPGRPGLHRRRLPSNPRSREKNDRRRLDDAPDATAPNTEPAL